MSAPTLLLAFDGSPAAAAAVCAAGLRADTAIVVCGSRGLGPFSRAAIGSPDPRRPGRYGHPRTRARSRTG